MTRSSVSAEKSGNLYPAQYTPKERKDSAYLNNSHPEQPTVPGNRSLNQTMLDSFKGPIVHLRKSSPIKENVVLDIFLSENSVEKVGNIVFFNGSESGTKESLLLRLFIEPTNRGKGFGSSALKEFLKYVKSLGIKKIFLAAEPIEKDGFKTFGQERKARQGLIEFYQKHGAIRVPDTYNEMNFEIDKLPKNNSADSKRSVSEVLSSEENNSKKPRQSPSSH